MIRPKDWCHDMAENGLQQLQLQFSVEMDECDISEYEQAFYVACEYGKINIAKWLLNEGGPMVSIHCIEEEYGRCGLMAAVEYNHLELVEWLLGQGADPHQKDALGETAATWALEDDGTEDSARIRRMILTTKQ